MTTRGAELASFLDRNVVLYAPGDDERKRVVAVGLLATQPTISTQVIDGRMTLVDPFREPMANQP